MAKYQNPTGGKGKIIGRPYQGTHGRSFNKKGGSDNWESENALDIAVPKGTPIYAVSSGVIGDQIGKQGGGRFAGLRVHLVTSNNEFYYAHLSKLTVKAGEHVVAGQVIGYSGVANGLAHLHFASKQGNPTGVVDGSVTTGETDQAQTQAQDAQTAQVDQTAQATSPTTPEQDQALQSDIANISQDPSASPPLASTPLVGSTTDTFLAPSTASSGSTWQMIASNGPVSQDTQYLAQLSQYGENVGQP